MLAEALYQELLFPERIPSLSRKKSKGGSSTGLDNNSIHLESWPRYDKKFIDKKVIEQMMLCRQIVSLALEARVKAGIPVRQPLSKLMLRGYSLSQVEGYTDLIKDEINVKAIEIKKGKQLSVELDTAITTELREEGWIRELIRNVNAMRKDAGLTIADRITVYYDAPVSIGGVIVKHRIILERETLSSGWKQKNITAANAKAISVGDSTILISF